MELTAYEIRKMNESELIRYMDSYSGLIVIPDKPNSIASLGRIQSVHQYLDERELIDNIWEQVVYGINKENKLRGEIYVALKQRFIELNTGKK